MSDPQALRAEVDRAFELHERGALDAACEAYDRLLAQPREDDDPVTVESRFAARFDRATIDAETGRFDAAAAGFAAAGGELDPTNPEHRHERGMAALNRGIALGLDGRLAQASAVYQEAIDELAAAEDTPSREQRARLQVNLASILLQLDRPADAAAVAERTLQDLDDCSDAWAAEQRALAQELATSAASMA